MKTLSSNTATAVDSPFVSPILLAQITFSSPSALTLYLCSRPFGTRNTFNGNCYDPLIAGWSPIRAGEIDPITYATRGSDTTINIINDVAVGGYDNISKLLAYYDWAFAVATLMEIHEGALAADDEENIFVGRVENLNSMDRTQVAVQISGIELAYREKWDHIIVNTTDYSGADPDDVGKMLPQVWGSCKRVPFRAVDAGWITTLAQDLDDGDTGNVDFTDVSGFPSSGTIQIGDEQMTYGSKSDANNTLNVSARGQNSTSDVDHDHGEKTAEIQSDYFYIMGHAVKAIDAVYIGDVLADTADYTAYTGQSGDEHASYTGKACIKFTVLPILIRQVNHALDDAIGVTEPGHAHSTDENSVTDSSGIEVDENGVNHEEYAIDGNLATYAIFDSVTDWAIYRFSYTSQGTLNYIKIKIKHCYETSYGYAFKISVNDGDQQYLAPYSTPIEEYFTFTPAQGAAWSVDIKIECGLYHDRDYYLYEIEEVKFYYGGDDTGSQSSGASKTGTVTLYGNSVADTVIGGLVSADIDGYQDDGSGTYTGSANALIERPDHIFKHWIKGILGLADAQIDSTSYTASGTTYGTESFKFGICLLEPPKNKGDMLNLFSKAARQCRSIQFWEAGVHHLIYMATSPSSDKTIDGNRMDLNQLWITFTMRSNVKNSLSATYDKHWGGFDDQIESQRAIVVSTASGSITKYGTLKDELNFDFVTTSAMAQAILDWIKGDLDEPRLLINWTMDQSALELERGDIVAFKVGDSELLDALLGFITSDSQKFRILDKVYLGDFREQIKAVEI